MVTTANTQDSTLRRRVFKPLCSKEHGADHVDADAEPRCKARRLDMPPSSIRNWLQPETRSRLSADGDKRQPISEAQAEITRLRREVASLRVDNEILRKAATYFAKGVVVKYAWIEGQSDHYPVSRICRVLGVSRTGYLQWLRWAPAPRQRRNDELGAQLRVIHAENGVAPVWWRV